jgi:NDP-sugar pyrophosphorylase family protein
MLAAGLGTRLWPVTGGRPKQLLDVGGMTLFERQVALARELELEPVVVTRPEFVAEFAGHGAAVESEDNSPDLLVTLSNVRRFVRDTYVWIGGDILFTEFAPLHEILAAHRAERPQGSFFYASTDRFKAKLKPGRVPETPLTREGVYPFSLPCFGVHEPGLFAYMPGDLADPRGHYLQRALEHGEAILFREYRPPVFEIDTPADLAVARRHFELVAQAS